MKNRIYKIEVLLKNNRKVVENYFFMTVLQVLNSLFYLIIYPFLIHTLGAESYGLYVFAMSIVTYFIVFVSYGFDLPAVKSIAQGLNDDNSKAYTLSCVFTAKIYLEILSTLVFVFFVLLIPALRVNWMIFLICYIQTLSGIFFPQWYFQGVQRMRVVTFIQLFFKILSLPFIFLIIKQPSDLWIFALITSLISLFGAFTAAFIVKYKEGLRIKFVSFVEVRIWYKDAFPFFLSSSTGIIKEQSIAVIIGVFFRMKDVAIYDLANKIVTVPRTLLVSVNGALFPKVVANIKIEQIKKIIRFEIIVGLFVILFIALIGEWIVLFMGGTTMLASYPLAVILSITVLVWLVVGCYINFVFIPQNKYYFVTRNQLVAFISFFLYCMIGLLIVKSIYVLVISIALSGISEIVYCNYLIKKGKLL